MHKRFVSPGGKGKTSAWLGLSLLAWIVLARPSFSEVPDLKDKLTQSQKAIDALKRNQACKEPPSSSCSAIEALDKSLHGMLDKHAPLQTDKISEQNHKLRELQQDLIEMDSALSTLTAGLDCSSSKSDAKSKDSCEDRNKLDELTKEMGDGLLLEDLNLVVALSSKIATSQQPDARKQTLDSQALMINKLASKELQRELTLRAVSENLLNTPSALMPDADSSIDNAIELLSTTGATHAPAPLLQALTDLRRAVDAPAEKEQAPKASTLWLPLGFNLAAVILLVFAWKNSRRPLTSEPSSGRLGERLEALEQSAVSHQSRLSGLLTENLNLRKELEESLGKRKGLIRELQVSRERMEQLERQTSRQESTEQPSVTAAPSSPVEDAQRLQPREIEAYPGRLVEDYNAARQGGPEAQDRFRAEYNCKPMQCEDLAVIRSVGGRPSFSEVPRAAYFFAAEWQGRKCLLPQFLEYRSAQNMMNGIFQYPSGAVGSLKLKEPAYLTQTAEGGWILETAGEFADA